MMSKNQWTIEYERIGEDYAAGIIGWQEAEKRLRALGFNHDEITDQLDELDDDRGGWI
jgi:hypothetical protein